MKQLHRFGGDGSGGHGADREARHQSGGVRGDQPDEKSLQKLVEIAAVRLLARREHSVQELRRKLQSRGHPTDAIEPVITKLTAKRLVSDERFTASFVHHHAQRGQGPVRIRAQLRQQGVAAEAIESAVENDETDWIACAQAVRSRKFGKSPPRSLAERAKQARFLQYRGFNSDQIRAALKSDVESCDSVTDADAGLDPDPDV